MHDILLSKGMFSDSRDIFKVWEISDNILLTVKDRDIVASKTNRKSYVAHRMAPLPMHLNDLEGYFCCLKPLQFS